MKERLVQYWCEKSGTLFYYQQAFNYNLIERCPACGSKRIKETGRVFEPLNEYKKTNNEVPLT